MAKYNTDLICYILLHTWKDTCPGASHYYASIRYRDVRIDDVERRLTGKQAAALNRSEGRGSAWEAGDTTSRFDSKGEAVAACLRCIKRRRLDCKIVAVGTDTTVNPIEVVWCIDGFATSKLNVLWQKLDDMYKVTDDPWKTFGDAAVEKIFDSWWKIVNNLGGKKK